MKPSSVKKLTLVSFLVLMLSGQAAAQPAVSRIVTFGTSLSDPGNVFTFIKTMSLPPYDTLDPFLVPDAPYGMGGHHFSNGATWIEQFARPLGLGGNARPAFQAPGTEATNYAVGGARAREGGQNVLSAQVVAFLRDFNGAAPDDALYVVEMGGNDVRDALAAFAAGEDSDAVIREAVGGIGGNMSALYGAGARKFLVWNAPNIRLTPAVRILDRLFPGAGQAAEFLTISFNFSLEAALAEMEAELPEIKIVRFDVYQWLSEVVMDPGAFGLRVVDRACVTPGVPPFECRRPDEFLFWDGIHPTEAANSVIAHEAAEALARQ